MTACKTSLGELGTWGSGGTPLSSRAEYYGGDIPWLIIEDLNDGFVDRASRTITRLGLENSSAKIVPPGTLLIAMYGSIGKLGIPRIECATNQAIAYCKCDPSKVDTRFLFHLLLNERGRFLQAGRGGTQQNINQEFLRDYEVLLPPLSEQQRVARLLEQADRLRRTRRYALELSDSFLHAVFLELFGDPVRNTMDWNNSALEDVCVDGIGVKAGPFGSSLKKELYSKSGIRIYGQEQVIGGDFRIGDYYISEEMFSGFAAYEVRPGDLLISLVGSFGKVIVVPEDIERGIINPRLLKISPKPECMKAVFVAKLIEHPLVQRELLRMSHGGTMGILNASLLRALRVIVPPVALQQKFVAAVERHERLRATQREALRQAQHLFQNLLHQAFSEGMSC
jgi:type I restriction enzyme S subunit